MRKPFRVGIMYSIKSNLQHDGNLVVISADSPYIHSYFNLPYNSHLSTTATTTKTPLNCQNNLSQLAG